MKWCWRHRTANSTVANTIPTIFGLVQSRAWPVAATLLFESIRILYISKAFEWYRIGDEQRIRNAQRDSNPNSNMFSSQKIRVLRNRYGLSMKNAIFSITNEDAVLDLSSQLKSTIFIPIQRWLSYFRWYQSVSANNFAKGFMRKFQIEHVTVTPNQRQRMSSVEAKSK